MGGGVLDEAIASALCRAGWLPIPVTSAALVRRGPRRGGRVRRV